MLRNCAGSREVIIPSHCEEQSDEAISNIDRRLLRRKAPTNEHQVWIGHFGKNMKQKMTHAKLQSREESRNFSSQNLTAKKLAFFRCLSFFATSRLRVKFSVNGSFSLET